MVKPSLLASLVPVENEWDILTELFEAGLEKFYLRKPGMRLKDYEGCLKNIPERFMDRVVLHEHFTIMYEYPYKEIHLKTRERKGFAVKDRFIRLIDEAHQEGLICSTSVHSFEELREMDGILDRLWVSPVFDSISSPGHSSEIDWIKTLNNKYFHSKIVALGGEFSGGAPVDGSCIVDQGINSPIAFKDYLSVLFDIIFTCYINFITNRIYAMQIS